MEKDSIKTDSQDSAVTGDTAGRSEEPDADAAPAATEVADAGTTPSETEVGSADAPAPPDHEGYLTAVLVLSGKQHYVRVGDDVEIRTETLDKIPTDEPFEVTELLLAYLQGDDGSEPRNITFGAPYLKGATASLKYKSARKNKGVSFKKRRRKHSSKTLRGYKNYTVRLAVEGLSVPGVGQETLSRSGGIEVPDPAI